MLLLFSLPLLISILYETSSFIFSLFFNLIILTFLKKFENLLSCLLQTTNILIIFLLNNYIIYNLFIIIKKYLLFIFKIFS